MKREGRVARSALWSAYGDALGFITELTDERGLSSRTGGLTKVQALVPWRRQLGGKYGVLFPLPCGMYSDDTQLRLATSRCIRSDGGFDPEPFSKVELPIFLSYCLGAGLGSKSAAESLRKQDIQWTTNFFQSGDVSYLNGGGNGVAMRIQPHVWAAGGERDDKTILLDVVRNGITTHGHPLALIGAGFHALSLLYALRNTRIPDPEVWPGLLDQLAGVPKLIADDSELGFMWLPTWERLTGAKFSDRYAATLSEFRAEVERISNIVSGSDMSDRDRLYRTCVTSLGCNERKYLGTGTKTALLANVIAHLFDDAPQDGMVATVNFLRTDTDSIATMAGAILGSITDDPPRQAVIDAEYITKEARRLISTPSSHLETHPFPDLAVWSPPKSNIDSVGMDNGQLFLRGMGRLNPIGQPVEQGKGKDAMWRLCGLPWGQTVVIHHRTNPLPLNESDRPIRALPGPKFPEPKKVSPHREPTKGISTASGQGVLPLQGKSLDAIDYSCTQPEITRRIKAFVKSLAKEDYPNRRIGNLIQELSLRPLGIESAVEFTKALLASIRKAKKSTEASSDFTSLDQMTADAIKGEFRPEVMGDHIRALALSGVSPDAICAYSAIIAKALLARQQRNSGGSRP